MSESQRKAEKKITTMMVMIVVLTTSVRVGQETFFISSATSCANCRTFAIHPSGFETKACLFCSSATTAAPSRVLDVAIVTPQLTEISTTPGAGQGKPTPKNEQGYQDSNPNFRFWRPAC